MSCHLGLVHIPRGTNTCSVHLLDNKLVGSHVDLYIHFQLTKNNNNKHHVRNNESKGDFFKIYIFLHEWHRQAIIALE